MTLLTRISRLFRADFHALLDSLEEPDVLLRQALREMEEELLNDEQRAKRRAADLDRLKSRSRELRKSLDSIADELDICLAADREPLARNLIKRRLEAERLLENLAQQIASLEKSLDGLEARIKDQHQRLEAMRQKAALFAEEQHSSAESSNTYASASVSDEDVEIALLREKQRRMPS